VPNDTGDFSQMLKKNQSDDKGPKTLSVLKEIEVTHPEKADKFSGLWGKTFFFFLAL
jgi:hypothetical protein